METFLLWLKFRKAIGCSAPLLVLLLALAVFPTSPCRAAALGEDMGRIIAYEAPVRITAFGSESKFVALFLRQANDSLLIRVDGSVSSIPVANVALLEVCTELRPRTQKGFLIGLLTGVVAGGLAGAASASEGDEISGAALGALLFGAIGGAVGGVIGNSVRTEEWLTVYPTSEIQGTKSSSQIRDRRAPDGENRRRFDE